MPTVSIVVPCFNGGRFLDALLASIDKQTFRDFEVIIVDDGSNEPQTIEKLASLPKSIRVVTQKNRGLSAARNTGFREAKADLVLPVDCDDTLEPHHLAETVPLLQQAPADVGFIYTDERLTGEGRGISEHFFNRYDQLFVNRLSYCILIRKEVWRAVGGYDETMLNGYEDWEFNIRLGKSEYRGIRVAMPLLNYTVSATGMLMSKSSRQHASLWSDIRKKHPELYNPSTLYRLWREEGTRLGLGYTLGLLAASVVLPESWFGAGVHWMRRHKLKQRQKQAENLIPANS